MDINGGDKNRVFLHDLIKITEGTVSEGTIFMHIVFKGTLKGQESKSWDFFEGPRRFRGPQKSEKFYFSKRTKTSVDHKFKSFAIN